MKFALLALVGVAVASQDFQEEDDNQMVELDAEMDMGQGTDDSESEEEEASKYTAKEQTRATAHVKDPNVKARFEYARDKCKNVPDKQKKACFKRNWRLYKPSHNNTIHDYRARAHRKCW